MIKQCLVSEIFQEICQWNVAKCTGGSQLEPSIWNFLIHIVSVFCPRKTIEFREAVYEILRKFLHCFLLRVSSRHHQKKATSRGFKTPFQVKAVREKAVSIERFNRRFKFSSEKFNEAKKLEEWQLPTGFRSIFFNWMNRILPLKNQ